MSFRSRYGSRWNPQREPPPLPVVAVAVAMSARMGAADTQESCETYERKKERDGKKQEMVFLFFLSFFFFKKEDPEQSERRRSEIVNCTYLADQGVIELLGFPHLPPT